MGGRAGPGVWRHGDWVTVTDRGSLVIHGRSDATLNRHGIRMGSADIHEVVEGLDAVTEAFVVGIDGPSGAYWMPLFVTLADGPRTWTTPSSTPSAPRSAPSRPRHVPDDVIAAPASRTPHRQENSRCRSPRSWPGHSEVSMDPRAIDRPDLIDWYRESRDGGTWT